MTGPEHYRQAEQLIGSAGEFVAEGDAPAAARCAAIAQVHATLALAAATADAARLPEHHPAWAAVHP